MLAGALALAEKDDKPFESEIIRLAEKEVLCCRGCRICMDRGEELCPHRDSAAEICAKMREADAVILASPVYVEDVCGSMKNLIDRMAYNCYRPQFAGKLAFVLVTSGTGATPHTAKTMAAALQLWGFVYSGALRLRMGAWMNEADLAQRHGKAVKKAAKKVYTGLKSGRAQRPPIRSLLVFAVQQISWRKERAKSVTLEHWRGKGWLDAGCTYYIPHRKNALAKGAARVIGRVLALFFT
jgi:multimeric flavodoxin WrbA